MMDIVTKFGTHPTTVRPVLVGMLADKLLSVEVRRTAHHYVAGPAL